MRTWTVPLVASLLLGCGAAGTSAPNPGVGTLPDTVSLRIGQAIRFGSVVVTFAGVPEDSRCPTDVTCVWAGNGVVELAVGPAFGEGPAFQLLVNSSQGPAGGEAWGLRITLLDLAPVPVSTHPIRPRDYVARLDVEPARGKD